MEAQLLVKGELFIITIADIHLNLPEKKKKWPGDMISTGICLKI